MRIRKQQLIWIPIPYFLFGILKIKNRITQCAKGHFGSRFPYFLYAYMKTANNVRFLFSISILQDVKWEIGHRNRFPFSTRECEKQKWVWIPISYFLFGIFKIENEITECTRTKKMALCTTREIYTSFRNKDIITKRILDCHLL